MIIFWALYVLTLFLILSEAAFLNWHIIPSWTWSRKQQDDPVLPMKAFPEIILLLPVLREQRHLRRALRSLEDLSYPGPKRIVVITTEREIAEKRGEAAGTTVEMVKSLLVTRQGSDPVVFEHMHFPHVVGNKASQLNYALQEIIKNQEMLATTYIGVYDADSRPGKNTLLCLLQLVTREERNGRSWPIALQQPALFLGNFQRVSWYLQMEALFQTRWVFGHEIRTLRASTRFSSHLLAPYAYCVGHGMFIRADFLQRTGGFPEPSEDIPLGHRLAFLGIPIHPLPAYDVCEVAPRVSTLIRQSGFWFCNAPLIWHEYSRIRQFHMPTRKTSTITRLVKGMLDLFSWVHYPLHVFSLFLLLVNGAPLFSAFLSALVCYLDAGVGMVLMLVLFPVLSSLARGTTVPMRLSAKIRFVLCAPLRPLVRGLAPIVACWYLGKTLLLKRENVFPKTSR